MRIISSYEWDDDDDDDEERIKGSLRRSRFFSTYLHICAILLLIVYYFTIANNIKHRVESSQVESRERVSFFLLLLYFNLNPPTLHNNKYNMQAMMWKNTSIFCG